MGIMLRVTVTLRLWCSAAAIITRVVDDAVHKITIKNTGKYDALYQFFLRTDLIKELVTVTPDSGPLQPGESATIEVGC
jgi:hypothetical protein